MGVQDRALKLYPDATYLFLFLFFEQVRCGNTFYCKYMLYICSFDMPFLFFKIYICCSLWSVNVSNINKGSPKTTFFLGRVRKNPL